MYLIVFEANTVKVYTNANMHKLKFSIINKIHLSIYFFSL